MVSISERGGIDDWDDFDEEDFDDSSDEDETLHTSRPLKVKADGSQSSFPTIVFVPFYWILFLIGSAIIVFAFAGIITGWKEVSPIYEYHAEPWQVDVSTPQTLSSNHFWYETVHLYGSNSLQIYIELDGTDSKIELLVLKETQFFNWNESKSYSASHDEIITNTPQNITVSQLEDDQIYYIVLYNAPSLNSGNSVTIAKIRMDTTTKTSSVIGFTTIIHEGLLTSFYLPLPDNAWKIVTVILATLFTFVAHRFMKKEKHVTQIKKQNNND